MFEILPSVLSINLLSAGEGKHSREKLEHTIVSLLIFSAWKMIKFS